MPFSAHVQLKSSDVRLCVRNEVNRLALRQTLVKLRGTIGVATPHFGAEYDFGDSTIATAGTLAIKTIIVVNDDRPVLLYWLR